MLPRIANLDGQFARAIRDIVQMGSRSTPLLREIKAHVIHEGHGAATRRSDSELEVTKIREATAETVMPFEEIENADLNYVLAKAREISNQFQKHFSQGLFQTMDEVTQRTRQRMDGRGAPLTTDMMIELFSKMPIDFERSQSGDVAIVAPPEMLPTFERLEREMTENPATKKRWDAMIEEKRNEFREREINRNLVG